MLYCEDCMDLTEETECPNCGNKHLREAQDNDPVYLITKDTTFAASIENILKHHDIPCLKKAFVGAGIISRTGYAQSYKIFVPYGAHEKAEELLDNFFSE